MKRTSVSKRAIGLDKISLPHPGNGYSLNACFLYQDAAAKKWSKEVCERVIKSTGPESLRRTWWKMEDLAEPGVLAGAVSVALRADVLVVALNAAQTLPHPFYAWVESWLPYRYGPAGALLVLMGNPEAGGPEAANTRDYLRAVAHIGRMEFILEERRLAAVDPELWPESSLSTDARSHRQGNLPNLACLPAASV